MANELQWAQSHFAKYNPAYKTYTDYYEGRHEPAAVTKHSETVFGRLFSNFRDNLCPTIVNTFADRLQVEAFESGNTAAAEYIERLWKMNRMDGNAGIVHSQAILQGDCYVMVHTDAKGGVRITPQKPGVVAVRYDYDGEQDSIVEAVKAWNTADGRMRVTRYFPDRVERYISIRETSTIPTSLKELTPFDADGSPAVVEHTWGRVPVFHFSNGLEHDDFAQSELKDVVPLQNALNMSIAYMLLAQEYSAIPQKWLVGGLPPIDPATGKATELKSEPGGMWFFGDPNIKLGEFTPVDVTSYIAAQDAYKLDIARVSRTPVHLFMLQSGDFPSGEALKTAEAPLIAKVQDRQIYWGNVWEDVVSFACSLAGIDAGTVECKWTNTTPHSDKEQSDIAYNLINAGLPKRFVLKQVYNSSDEEVDAMMEDKAAENSALTEQAAKQFNAGAL